MKNSIARVEGKFKEISQKVEQNEQKIGERKNKKIRTPVQEILIKLQEIKEKKEIFNKIAHETFPKPKIMNFQIERVY